MAEAATKLPIRTEKKEIESTPEGREWWPFESLRREIDRAFDRFLPSYPAFPFSRSVFDAEPFWRGEISWGKSPAVDIVEQEKSYEMTAELPGMEPGNLEVNFSDGMLTIKGEKKEEKEEKKKDFYLAERRYGSFQRSFRVPEGVDANKIEANFKNGVLTVSLPKTAEAQAKTRKIPVKAA